MKKYIKIAVLILILCLSFNEGLCLADVSAKGYYSGIAFESNTSPYCKGSDRTYNTDHKLYVTPVKNQGKLNTCWIFGAVGAMESAIFKQYGKEVDLSEQYVIYATSNNELIENPYNSYLGMYESFNGEKSGGHEGIITAFWASGTLESFVEEKDLPYLSYATSISAKQLSDIQDLSDKSLDYYAAQTILLKENDQYSGNNYSAYTGAAYIQKTKDLIKAFGSAAAGISMEGNVINNNGESAYNYSEYYNGSYDCNHQVLLVGWNDDYDMGASHKGAFLAKNSFGPTWGYNIYGNGYFWISYDSYITDVLAVARVVHESDLYDRIYETEGTLLQAENGGYFYSSEYALMKRTYKTGSNEELLTGIMVYNANPESEYKVFYTDSDEVTDSTVWTELPCKSIGAIKVNENTGYICAHDTGYLAIEFETPPTVSGNYTLSVVVRNQNIDYNIYGTEYYDPLYGTEVSSSLWYDTSEITADTINSAIRLDAYSPVNFTLKAYTKQIISTVTSLEIPDIFNKGSNFSSNRAVFKIGDWSGSIKVYNSFTQGSSEKYISAGYSQGKLALTVKSELRDNLTNYSQKCYLGFKDEYGNEYRIPVTIGKNKESDNDIVFKNGLLYVNGTETDLTYYLATYDDNGQMLGKVSSINVSHIGITDYRALPKYTVMAIDSDWKPKNIY